MGLIKKDGYNVKGVELETAYAKINRLYIEKGNLARTYFGISNSRENINEGNSLIELEFPCYVDKNQPIYEQVYVLAKENLFQGWEDDIVVETPIEESTEEETVPEVDNMMPEDMPQVGIVPETEEKEDNNVSTMPAEEDIEVKLSDEQVEEDKEDSNDKYFDNKDEEIEETIEEPTEPERGSW